MKKILITILTLWSAISYGQTIITSNTNNNPRPTPKVGYNSNALTMPSINNQSFVDSVRKLEVPVFRYPGGTNSQYWDWQNGKSLPPSAWVNNGGTLQNYAYLGTTPMVPLPLAEFKRLIDSLGAKPLYVLNVLSRNLSDQMNMLRAAQNIGLEVELVELGNEMYFQDADFVNRFYTAGVYAREMNIWTDSIKAQFPNSKVAIIGTTEMPTMPNGNPMPARIRYWNDSIFTFYNYNDAITLHNYFRHNNTAQTPNPTQVLSSAFSEWQVGKQYSVDSINNGMDIWFTEYNMNDDLNNYRVATSWLHGLFTSAIHLQLLESSKIGMIINHQITGAASYASLDSYTSFGDTLTNRLTAEGNAMRLLHKAYKNMDFADKLTFSSNPTITYNSFNYPSLVGWTFFNNDKKNIIVLNVSNSAFIFNASSFTNGSFDYETITSNNLTQTNVTTSNLSISKGTSTNVNIPAYSLTLLEENLLLSINQTKTDNLLFKLYPNPANTSVTIELKNSFPVEICILNLHGQIILKRHIAENKTLLDISDLPSGIYIIQTTQNNTILTKKLIKN